MKWMAIDLETAYSQEYSLSKMTTASYILNPAFELICLAYKTDPKHPSTTLWGEDAENFLRTFDWSDYFVVSHNARFDMAVLAWRFNAKPKMYSCTMALADAILAPFSGSASLASVASQLGLPPKGDEVMAAKGKWRRDFTPEQARAYMAYCARDNDTCADAFVRLAKLLPRQELRIIDDLARMFIEPVFCFDQTRLYQYLAELEADQERLLAMVGLPDRDKLMSNQHFANLLIDAGVTPPTKVSPTTKVPVFAFSKTDEDFVDLLDDDDEYVAALVAARLGHKSTIEATRARRFIDTSHLTKDHLAPVPLRYAAALTHRFGGTDSENWQNLRRRDVRDPGANRPGVLRSCVKALPGWKIVTVDASQIELRVLMWLSRQLDALEILASGKSIYIEFGRFLYSENITKADTEKYTLSKIAVLSSGYGVSGKRFRQNARAQSGGLLRLDVPSAEAVIIRYRQRFREVKKFWERCHGLVDIMASPLPKYDAIRIDGRDVIEAMPCALKGPTGLFMNYPELEKASTTRGLDTKAEYTYTFRRRFKRRLYGPKLTENICQHIARCIVCDAQDRIRARTGLHPALQGHDELVYAVPADHVEALRPVLMEEMSRRPSWAPGLPLGAEVGVGDNYGEAK